jgi:hypothetical protein
MEFRAIRTLLIDQNPAPDKLSISASLISYDGVTESALFRIL